MKILMTREGGFVGITNKADVEFEELTTDEQNVLNKLATQPVPVAKNASRDAFAYSISMKKNGKNVSLNFNDMNVPPKISAIFQKYVN